MSGSSCGLECATTVYSTATCLCATSLPPGYRRPAFSAALRAPSFITTLRRPAAATAPTPAAAAAAAAAATAAASRAGKVQGRGFRARFPATAGGVQRSRTGRSLARPEWRLPSAFPRPAAARAPSTASAPPAARGLCSPVIDGLTRPICAPQPVFRPFAAWVRVRVLREARGSVWRTTAADCPSE